MYGSEWKEPRKQLQRVQPQNRWIPCTVSFKFHNHAKMQIIPSEKQINKQNFQYSRMSEKLSSVKDTATQLLFWLGALFKFLVNVWLLLPCFGCSHWLKSSCRSEFPVLTAQTTMVITTVQIMNRWCCGPVDSILHFPLPLRSSWYHWRAIKNTETASPCRWLTQSLWKVLWSCHYK